MGDKCETIGQQRANKCGTIGQACSTGRQKIADYQTDVIRTASYSIWVGLSEWRALAGTEAHSGRNLSRCITKTSEILLWVIRTYNKLEPSVSSIAWNNQTSRCHPFEKRITYWIPAHSRGIRQTAMQTQHNSGTWTIRWALFGNFLRDSIVSTTGSNCHRVGKTVRFAISISRSNDMRHRHAGTTLTTEYSDSVYVWHTSILVSRNFYQSFKPPPQKLLPLSEGSLSNTSPEAAILIC